MTAGLLALLTVGDGFIYLVLQDRDSFAVQWFPLLYVGTNVIYLLLAVPLGRLADRWGRVKVFLCGHLALLACYVLAAAPFGGLGITLACLMLLGLFYAATDGVLAALASRLVAPEKVATGIGAARPWWRCAGWRRPRASASSGSPSERHPPCWRPPSRWLWPWRLRRY